MGARVAVLRGFLSMQVNPKLYPDSERMVEHGRTLAVVAPNAAIKAPATAAGIKAARRLPPPPPLVGADRARYRAEHPVRLVEAVRGL